MMSEKRVLKNEETKGFSVQDLIIVAVLLAAGAVLKMFVGSVVNFFGMKPNFTIASYCLAILLVRPKLPGCAIIGLLAGAICQFLPGTPWLNLISELLGAVTMFFMMKVPLVITVVILVGFLRLEVALACPSRTSSRVVWAWKRCGWFGPV